MSVLSKSYFHSADAARRELESILWPDGPTCPHCGAANRIYDLKKTRPGLKKCGHCRRQFTVTVGTVFESSHIKLHLWFQATFLMCSSKKGISAHQLHRTLEVTYKTAWFMAHRIREAMRDDELPPLGGKDKAVEVDETYWGGKRTDNDYRFINNRGWVGKSGNRHKWKVLSLVERGGRARSIHVDRLNAKEVRFHLVTNVDRQSHLMTDEASFYVKVGREFASHGRVNHSKGEYRRGDASINTIEGFFSIFKRGMKGVYQHCGEQHLQRYLAEFDFRYNGRNISDSERTINAIRGIVGKRLTYETPIA